MQPKQEQKNKDGGESTKQLQPHKLPAVSQSRQSLSSLTRNPRRVIQTYPMIHTLFLLPPNLRRRLFRTAVEFDAR